MLLGFGVSHVFFNRGEIDTSVPLVYPVLLYLLARLLWIGFRPRERRERLVPLVPVGLLALGIVLLVGFRVGLNVVDSNAIDVGYAGVIGADRIADGDPLYGPGFSDDVERGDTYGPVTYLAYVPFEQAMPWSGAWDDLPAAHGAALAFDLLTLLGLVLLGRRLRPGRGGPGAGRARSASRGPPTRTRCSRSRPTPTTRWWRCSRWLAMLGLTIARPRASALARGAAVGLAAAAKFAPLALAPLFATAGGGDGASPAAVFALALAAVAGRGVRPVRARRRPARALRPHGRLPGVAPVAVQRLGPGRVARAGSRPPCRSGAVLLALAVAFVPRRKTPVQVAALAAAVLIAVQLGATHWFYLYVVWFAPLALVACMAPWRGAGRDRAAGRRGRPRARGRSPREAGRAAPARRRLPR